MSSGKTRAVNGVVVGAQHDGTHWATLQKLVDFGLRKTLSSVAENISVNVSEVGT